MTHLKKFGLVVYLDVPLEELQTRIHNYDTRGIARRPDQSFAELFEERRNLYQRYADITVFCGDKKQEQIIEEIIYAEGETYSEIDA